jgi:hypothetical protein
MKANWKSRPSCAGGHVVCTIATSSPFTLPSKRTYDSPSGNTFDATGTLPNPVAAEIASASSFDAGPQITFNCFASFPFRMQTQVLRLYDLLFLWLFFGANSRPLSVTLENHICVGILTQILGTSIG